MKAMILAAGLGTRLRPLTDNIPKALVKLNGRTLLEIAIERLKSFGVTEIIVNVHHHAEKIAAFLHSKNNFGIRVELSREDDLLPATCTARPPRACCLAAYDRALPHRPSQQSRPTSSACPTAPSR